MRPLCFRHLHWPVFVGIDFDDTIYPLSKGQTLSVCLNQIFPVKAQVLSDYLGCEVSFDEIGTRWKQLNPAEQYLLRARCNKLRPTVPPFEGFRTLLKPLAKKGYQFLIISAGNSSKSITKYMVIHKLHDMFASYHCGIVDKARLCSELGVHVLIDDQWRQVNSSAPNLKLAIWLRQEPLIPASQKTILPPIKKNIIKCVDWHQVAGLLEIVKYKPNTL